ncbi:hypothetical protein ACFFU1_05965 [Algibacter miyuki]|uniref:LPS export ABC transporter periplasmic protein LptC n=1 Tax=Algibacter miyuki TaxID=1306933 RepID=A0ABV5GXT2_9FLAO|nr:hypothetical protein [Algibacter miyuki]MDN3667473.1 hypothetical protein [Algibacter miyuki]
MKKIFFFACTISLVFMSCDGRNRMHQSNREVLESANLLESFSTRVYFVPQEEVKIHTDTIMSSGFHVKLNYNSIEGQFVSKTEVTKGKTQTKIHFKNFEAQLSVLKQGQLLTHSLINKSLFKEYATPDFWEQAIMQHVWLNHEQSTAEMVCLNTSFRILNTNTFKDFSILIDTFGNLKIKEVNLLPNTI